MSLPTKSPIALRRAAEPVAEPPSKPKIVFRRSGIVEKDKKGPGQGVRPDRSITDLEKTILTNNNGMLTTLSIPEVQPDTEQIERQSQLMTAVENLMFQGIRTPHLIAQALRIAEPLAAKLVKGVNARWAVLGGEVDIKTQRGEALRYMDFLQNQLWTQFTSCKTAVALEERKPMEERSKGLIRENKSTMISLNNQIAALNKQRNDLYGLTPQAIQTMLVIGGTQDNEVLSRLRKQEGVRDMLGKLGNMLERVRAAKAQRIGGVIEAEEV